MTVRARPTRRQVILASVATGALLVAPPAKAQATLADFMALSRQLAGPWDLDPDMGATYLRALTADPTTRATLDSLIDQGDDGSDAIADLKRTILKQWYLGTYDDGGQPAVATFERALMWRALGFDQPIGTCRGPTGYWSEPPTN